MQSSKEQQEEIEESIPQLSIQRNRGKRQNVKELRSLQDNQRYQRNISCKDGLNKGQKQQDLTEAEEIKKAGKNTQKNCTKKSDKSLVF